MPDVTATVTVPDSKVRLLNEALQAYRDQKGLDETYTLQMWLDELFRNALIGQWTMADQAELKEFRDLLEAADDTTRQQVRDILEP